MPVSRTRIREGVIVHTIGLLVTATVLMSSVSCSAFVPSKELWIKRNGNTYVPDDGHSRPNSCSLGYLSASSNKVAQDESLAFRAPKPSDVEAISDLLVDCFETELKWFEFPERESRRKRYRDMLQKSFLRKLEAAESNDGGPASLSFMLMVESAKDNQIVGFVQLGQLPSPPGFTTTTTTTDVDGDDDRPTGTDPDQEPVTWNGIPVEITQQAPDVPYIANLCVLPSCRKSGIGKKMVDISLRWLDKKQGENNDNPKVFIAVDSDNFLAKRFYERIGFVWIEPPDDGSGKLVAAKRDYYFRSVISA